MTFDLDMTHQDVSNTMSQGCVNAGKSLINNHSVVFAELVCGQVFGSWGGGVCVCVCVCVGVVW